MLKSHSKIISIIFLIFNIFVTHAAFAANIKALDSKKCAPISHEIVENLFDRWNNSLATNDPDKVVANYATMGVLLPTVSNEPRTTHAKIRDYFVDFLQKNPVGHIDKRVVTFGCNWATDTGLYTFTLNKNGKKTEVKARYSFVYEYIDGSWLIINHHSSVMPENIKDADKIEYGL